jgi:hypothetical protein
MIVTSYQQAYHRKYQKTVDICHTEFKNSWQRSYLFVIIAVFYAIPCILLFFQYGRIIYILKNTHVCKLNVTYESSVACQKETNDTGTKLLSSTRNNSRKTKFSIVRMRPPIKNHKQTTKMLFVMMILFFICILPYRIFAIWAVYAQKEDFERLGIENYYNILAMARIMFYLNSAINPILYHILSTKFQAAFKKSFICCRGSTPQIKHASSLKK